MTGFDLPPASTPSYPTVAYPLTLSFKLLAMSHQFELIDANGQCIAYVKQPWMKLKEAVTVYTDASMQSVIYTIAADRVLDFNANYAIASAQGTALGQLRRHGVQSLFKAHYELVTVDSTIYPLQETNPWVKLLDGLLQQIPFLGILTGYFLHPRYALADHSGNEVMEIRKVPSLLERKFEIAALASVPKNHENACLLACLMTVLLESNRG